MTVTWTTANAESSIVELYLPEGPTTEIAGGVHTVSFSVPCNGEQQKIGIIPIGKTSANTTSAGATFYVYVNEHFEGP